MGAGPHRPGISGAQSRCLGNLGRLLGWNAVRRTPPPFENFGTTDESTVLTRSFRVCTRWESTGYGSPVRHSWFDQTGAQLPESLSEAQLSLSRELVDDIETSQRGPEQILLKALRLARLRENTGAAAWLRWELGGYANSAECRPWMRYFGRFLDQSETTGYWMPLAGVMGTIAAMQTQVETLRVPNMHYAPSSSNPNEFVGGTYGNQAIDKVLQPGRDVLARLQALTTALQTLTSIRSKVLAAVHGFAVHEYHALAFSGLAHSIFEKHRGLVDARLKDLLPGVLEKIPSVSDRLAVGDHEAISQAMSTLRRVIKAVADGVYPPSESPITIDGAQYEIGSDKVLNRIDLFVRQHCPSETRSKRLKRTMADIHGRVCAAVHADVTGGEASALFLGTYLALGEILEIASQAKAQSAAKPLEADSLSASRQATPSSSASVDKPKETIPVKSCLWCAIEGSSPRRLEPGQPRECPECGHVFKGSGWDGIDAHWKAKHEGTGVPYGEFWSATSSCQRHHQ